jgi:hypothetical protein
VGACELSTLPGLSLLNSASVLSHFTWSASAVHGALARVKVDMPSR